MIKALMVVPMSHQGYLALCLGISSVSYLRILLHNIISEYCFRSQTACAVGVTVWGQDKIPFIPVYSWERNKK